MTKNLPIEIPFSKVKTIFLLAAAIGLFYLGYYFFDQFGEEIAYRIYGLAIMCFFGIASLYVIKKLFSGEIALTINSQGIIDNSSTIAVGLIAWKDVLNIQKHQIKSSQFLCIEVTNPELYIQKAKNEWVKRGMRWNLKMHNTPIAISSMALKCSFSQLEQWVREGWESSKK